MDLERMVADQWVVLSGHTIDRVQSFQRALVATWTPEPALVAEIAPVLMTDLQRRLDDLNATNDAMPLPRMSKPDPRDASEYFVQCVGVEDAGRRTVLLNGVHEGSMSGRSERWRTSLVRVCDGGSRYFCGIYDPATKQMLWFRFHGLGAPPRENRGNSGR